MSKVERIDGFVDVTTFPDFDHGGYVALFPEKESDDDVPCVLLRSTDGKEIGPVFTKEDVREMMLEYLSAEYMEWGPDNPVVLIAKKHGITL